MVASGPPKAFGASDTFGMFARTPSMRPPLFSTPLFLGAVLTALSSAACSGQSALCRFRGTVNAPENRTMRRNAMATGLGEFCKQMLTRSAPLAMVPGQAATGRFFPTSCSQREADNGDLAVQFGGRGYTWTTLTKKVTFEMSGAVQYNQDFLVAPEKCDIYGYFRPRKVTSSDFKIGFVEQPAAQFVTQMSNMGTQFGKQLVGDNLSKGFTVIMLEDGGQDFGLGIIDLGKKPFHPLTVQQKGRMPIENNRVEVHSNERDFVGPFTVEAEDSSIWITAQSDGGVPIDVMVMRKGEGDQSLRSYLEQAAIGPLTGTPIWADVLQPAQVGFARRVPVPPGMYYVVLDNSSQAGTVAPPVNLFDDRAALVDYAIQIGKNP